MSVTIATEDECLSTWLCLGPSTSQDIEDSPGFGGHSYLYRDGSGGRGALLPIRRIISRTETPLRSVALSVWSGLAVVEAVGAASACFPTALFSSRSTLSLPVNARWMPKGHGRSH